MKNTEHKSGPPDPVTLCKSKDPAAIREILTKVGDKWSIFILLTLKMCPDYRARFTVIEKCIPGISQKMLTVTVRNLERDGLVLREIFAEIPPRVEYQLTPLGESLLDPLQNLLDWVNLNCEQVRKAQSQFDER
ncbi:helix-turn-helix domain-containing protein [Pseudomonas sp. SZMC_28357]|uniref:winged helix-turn-helix transcriptional regulator n=1 Tax=Pseudomonas sp. SZMC_28357 TaxID=3074380 RepID=UPI002870EBC4|nr:helix-turn-helix domain-containing protein [Pseudomonas sp. SZMC_28357]MDR9753789.1 helix-turn-helix domain-containing protein [Pseudomonas sp. SZMC_28357]